MRDLIKKILKEEMVSKLSNEQKFNLLVDSNTVICNTLISKDSETNDKLYLFVGFKNFTTISEYSYSFLLVDENNQVLGDGYMTERNEVESYIPQDIKNKRQIFPIIMKMTRELLDSYLPQNIFRKTVESVGGDSLKRYEEITNIMVNEYGYNLDSQEQTRDGRTIWYLSRGEVTNNNREMNESYEIIHEYSTQERLKMTFDWCLPLLPKDDKPLFECKFPKRG
jgi:hypothetical protein